VLRGFSKILSLVADNSLAVENPFALKTRAEVLGQLVTCKATSLIRRAISCAYVHRISAQHPHCGTCSQCIDRRFGILAAGLKEEDPAEGYAIDLVTGERKRDIDRLLLVDYIKAADAFTSCTSPEEFLSRFGEATRALLYLGMDAESGARALFEMHKRHGEAVDRVISNIFAEQAATIRRGRLPADSLPMLLFSEGLRQQGLVAPVATAVPPDPVLASAGEYHFRQYGENWTLRFRGGKPFSLTPDKGLTYLHSLLQCPGEILIAFDLVDLAEGREPSNRPPSMPLGVDKETLASVKSHLDELQQRRAEAEDACDLGAVEAHDKEIKEVAAYLNRECALGGKMRRESPEQKRARTAVSNAIRRAIQKISKHSLPMASHLKEQVQTGFYLKYRQTDIPWET
jgi:hypothetical protein